MGNPAIEKLGTIDCDVVETTPLVFRDRLYRFEYIRAKSGPTTRGYDANDTPDSYFRLVDVESQEPGPPFGVGLHLGSAYADEEAVHVFAVDAWGGSTVSALRSEDMTTWSHETALDLPGWRLFNTSVCRAEGRHVMAVEFDEPAARAGVPYTIAFAESADLRAWRLLAAEHDYSPDRYTACPALRHVDGWFYMLYLEALPGPVYEQWLVRSRDLRTWEPSPRNPVLRHFTEDRRVAAPGLTEAQRERIRGAVDRNNSDMDLCEFRGRTIINYAWGDQVGNEFLAEAVFPGTMKAFFEGLFPS